MSEALEKDDALWEGYLSRTRWFGGKGRPFRVSGVRNLAELPVLPAPEGAARVTVYLVNVEYQDDEGGAEQYHVPLSSYDDVQERIAYAFVGSVEREDGRLQHLYDGAHDRNAMALWLEGFIAAEESGAAQLGGMRFRRVVPGPQLDPALQSSPLTGEQSNSSVKFDDTAIMKLFRKVSPGVNPDIEIHEVLTRGGSDFVADLYGWIEIDLPGGASGEGQVLQLAMLQEFLRTASDGFELATGSVRTLLAHLELSVEESGGDFAGEATRLGEALAAVHAMMRDSFPAQGEDSTGELAGAMVARLEQARRIVPEIEPYAERLRAAYDAVAELGRLDVQRVHGDLHLGQTLRTSQGWKLVDFEGEPAKPLDERCRPQPAVRDVAGMLRSFDYVAGSTELARPERASATAEWADAARRAFLDGYVAASGLDLGAYRELLAAFELDKAVYEAIYETRSRPSWAAIPLRAITRQLDAFGVSDERIQA